MGYLKDKNQMKYKRKTQVMGHLVCKSCIENKTHKHSMIHIKDRVHTRNKRIT